MAVQMLIVLFAAIVLGVVLVALGIRGKRINRHPSCRDCGFDLSGTLPDGVTCPECGAGLKRPKAVREGQRRRMWIVTTVGALLVLLPVSGIGIATYAVLTGANLNQYKPVGLLLWETKGSNAQTLEAAAEEFTRRRQAGTLDPSVTSRIVDAALDIQNDPDRPWTTEWGDFIEMVDLDGNASKEQMQRFRDQCVTLECEVRPNIRPGEPLPIKFSNSGTRLGTGSIVFAQAFIRSATIDGQPLDVEFIGPQVTEITFAAMAFGMAGVGNESTVWGGMVSGDASPWGMVMGMDMMGGQTPALRLPDDLTPGTHRLRMVLGVRGREIDMNTNFDLSSNAPDNEREGHTLVLDVPFVVTTSDTAGIEVIEPTESMEQEIRDALTPVSGWIQSGIGFGGRYVEVSLENGNLPCDLAFEAFLRVDEKQLPLGTVLRAAKQDTGSPPFGMDMLTTDLSAMVGDVDISAAWLVLKPNPDLGLHTTDITRVYGGEIILKNLDIQDMSSFDNFSGMIDERNEPVDPTETDSETGQEDKSDSALDSITRFFLQKPKEE